MSISDISIRRPVMGWMMMLGLMIFGWISFRSMGISQLPNVEFPVISVSVSWEGTAPEVMESDVVDVIEQSIMTVQGVKDISSSVRQGQATITVELELGRDVDVAVQEVQTKIAQAQRLLPNDIDPPIVIKQNPAEQPIIWLVLRGERSPRELMEYVQDHLQDQFATVSGVGEVSLGGFVDPNLRVWVDREKLLQYQLTVQDVIDAIEKEHAELPAGRIETPQTEQNVRAMGEAASVEDFGNIRIPQRAGRPVYTPIYLKDVAVVEDGLADVRRISRSDFKTAIGLGIRKQTGSNEVEVARAVFKKLEKVRARLPQGMQLDAVVNRSKFIEDSIHELNITLILSAVVTSLVCWLFLGSWSATLNILLAIPVSILGAFMVIRFAGFTLNTFTILGLSLAIGMVVDDAIMVLENITRYREMGHSAVEGASRGARQISFAATASTAAIIAIFLPIVFMQGIMGKFFYEFGVTISAAVAISLFEALVFTPMRCAQFLRVGEHQSRFGRQVDGLFRRLASGYKKYLETALRRRRLVVAGAIALFVASLGVAGLLRKEFVPPQDQSMIFCTLRTAPGSSIKFTSERFKEAEKIVAARPEVKSYFAAIGGFQGGESNRGIIFVNLKYPHDRPVVPPNRKALSQKELMNIFREELNKIPGIKAAMQDLSLSGFSAQRGFPIELTVRGPDWDRLVALTNKMQDQMRQGGLMVDVNTDYLTGSKEVRVIPDRVKAAGRGVSVETIGKAIDALIGGRRVGKYTHNGRRYDIRVRLKPEQRLNPEDITSIYVWNNQGEMVQLKDVVAVEQKDASLNITRRGRERAITIDANVAPGKSQSDAIAAAQRVAKDVLPEGYDAVLGGSSQAFQESNRSFIFVFVMGIVVAYMVLASQFNSYLHPLTILMALPFSISGALAALWLTGQSLNIYSIIGVVLLMGIVKKNSILLVEFTNQLRAQGKGVSEAVLEACPIRLRPILMTSLATIVAAVPPALALGPGAEVRIPMSIAVIGGVLVSTLLTLFVVPCVYMFFTRFERRK
ncbi:MAG: efflux RND transporter permease subunit [Candidatus Omnitrophica bacterium]|nr:efflux RND transporter permease subunit [Candidatus Omnitrophota bacterium]